MFSDVTTGDTWVVCSKNMHCAVLYLEVDTRVILYWSLSVQRRGKAKPHTNRYLCKGPAIYS